MEYEEKKDKSEYKDKDHHEKKFVSKSIPDNQTNFGNKKFPQNSSTSGPSTQHYQGQNQNHKYQKNRPKPENKLDQGNQNLNSKKEFNNKFDSMNSGYNHPYMTQTNPYMNQQTPYMNSMSNNMGNMNMMNNMNQNFMMRPEMLLYQQSLQMQNPMFQNQLNNLNNVSQIKQEDNINIGKSIKESLEYYFSNENLNKDFYTRSKMDENGFIESGEILNFNNMKKQNADLDKLKEIICDKNSNIELKENSGKVYFRNKNWEEIKKNNLISIEDLKNLKKSNNMNLNYFNLQNNFYYNLPPMNPMDQQGMMNMQLPNSFMNFSMTEKN